MKNYINKQAGIFENTKKENCIFFLGGGGWMEFQFFISNTSS